MPAAEDEANARCPACGFESPAGFRFCGRCGHALGEKTGHDPSAEHRQVTVVFCDLVDSVALADHLDPEDLREVVCAYQSVASAVVERYAGHVAQYLGDGLLIYFGYPQAHEDDARRAVHAAQGILQVIEQLNQTLEPERGLRLRARMGIHTGLVVAGEVGGGSRREHLALGVTPNVAARLQALAPAGGVLLSRATARLIEGFFDCESLGQQQLKGIAQPLSVYRLVQESSLRGRFELAVHRGLVPMIGRQRELELMLDRLEQAADGRGQVVLVIGEAGIGKSRLVYELEQRLAGRPVLWRACRCSPYHTTSALYPVIELGRRLLQGAPDDLPETICSRLEQRLEALGFALGETLPLVADLLSLPLPPGYQRPELGAERKKQLTFEVLLGMVLRLSEDQPVVVCIEDLHWIDPSSLELIELLTGRTAMARLLVLLTARPGFVAPWAPLPHQTILSFERLTDAEALQMIEHVARGAALSKVVVGQLLQRADGVPLFVEELTRAVVESGSGVETDIPATLHGSLMARLDRLGAAKATAQLAAALGREFSYAMLRTVTLLAESELRVHLAQLVESQLCYQRGTPPRASYVFKHALIRDVAYDSLLKRQRMLLHRRIAEAIEEHFHTLAETEPELLARHLTLAALAEQATDAWLRAAQRAHERGSYQEALAHLEQGLAALEQLPAGPARHRCELGLRSLLGFIHAAIHGYASPEVERAFGRAFELCDEIGESESPFWLLRGLWAFLLVRGEFDHALELAHRIFQHPHKESDPIACFAARYSVGMTYYLRGELELAREHLERALELEAKLQDYDHRQIASGEDPGVGTLSSLAVILWLQGFPERAMSTRGRASEMARSLGHAFSECLSLSQASVFHLLRRETGLYRQASERLLAIAREKGFLLYELIGKAHQAFATVIEFGATATPAEPEEGAVWHERIAQMRAGARATGLNINVPLVLTQSADAFARRKLHDIAESLLDEAFVFQEQTGERAWEAELSRLRGELERDRNPEAAEAAFNEALAVARRQGALAFELRAAMGLAGLFESQGREEEARRALAPVYGRFAEGFDTPDLCEAREILARLSAPA